MAVGDVRGRSERYFYDLSELFHISNSSFKYYGIARCVMEVGYELARSDPRARFVVYAPGDGRFHEVTPRVGQDSPNGLIDPGLPVAARPIKMRAYDPGRGGGPIRAGLVGVVGAVNRRRWRAASGAAGRPRPIDLDGEVVVSLARPKLMVDFLYRTLGRGERMRFRPLLHDLIPLHEGANREGTDREGADRGRGGREGNEPTGEDSVAALPRFARKFLHDNRYVIERSERIVANSRFTAGEIDRFVVRSLLPPPRAVSVVPLAHELREGRPVALPPDIPERFVLMVGTAPGRKNLETVLAALVRLHDGGRPVPALVLAGALRKRTTSLLAEDRFAAIRERVVCVVDPSQDVLVALYKRALALILPSFIEGWGLPLGEALWVGTPGLAADIPVLREVGGDLALYFDPAAPDELAALVDRVANDERALAERRMVVRGGRSTLRSWADVASGIARVATSPDQSALGDG